MLQQGRRSLLSTLLGRRALSCACAAADPAVSAPEPGTVQEYHQHIAIQLPRPPAGGGQAAAAAEQPGAWWPELVEREPAVVAAFAAVARHQGAIGGRVKITAVEELAGSDGRAVAGPGPQPGTVNLLAFPAGLRFEGVPLEQVGVAVALATADNPSLLPLRATERKAVEARQAPAANLTLLVCCHSARDARCGQLGPPLAAALRQLVRQRGLQDQVSVLATSHIGGHKYAGNVIAYSAMHPCDGDWFGGVNAGNAAAFLDALLDVELGVDGGAEDPALRPFWRGRMGLSKEEQLDLFEQGGAVEDLEEVGSEAEEEEEDAEEMERLAAALEQRLHERGRSGQRPI
ncbi:hypothetical protein COHA_008837 [Chlorella ohadii]|uniref:Uncharacterized protein n=1 Tax=Chlorella ohadii TaxID=2649997 RepID=A0AAD5H2U3_9CHLO|nr:hypothetical protein COHA_008837 [Chlorella ohadii]